MQTVIEEVAAERANQDEQWGGPEHDDRHSVWDFHRYIASKLTRMHTFPGEPRRRLIQIAALAVAAIESIDRKAAADTDIQE